MELFQNLLWIVQVLFMVNHLLNFMPCDPSVHVVIFYVLHPDSDSYLNAPKCHKTK